MWTQELTDILIEEYRARPVLYDTKNPMYHNRVKKETAYQGVVDKLSPKCEGCTVEAVKRKLNGLRSHLSREFDKMKKKNKSGAGANDMYQPKVWWFQKMLFLKDHLEPRCSTSTMADEHDDQMYKVNRQLICLFYINTFMYIAHRSISTVRLSCKICPAMLLVRCHSHSRAEHLFVIVHHWHNGFQTDAQYLGKPP